MAKIYTTHQVAAWTEPYIEKLARVGYVAKGVIYGLIGILALVAAAGPGGKTTNQAGVINTIAQQPFGMILLIAIGAGLLGYALWRLGQAIFNPENKKVWKRIGYAISAFAYGGFGVAALLAGTTGERATSNSQENAATVLSLPGGQLLMFIGALVFAGIGLGQIVNGFGLKFTKIFETERMSPDELRAAMWFGRIGLMARGALFITIAWIVGQAAMADSASKVGGIERGLQTIAHAPAGPLLLGLMAAGLVCYGLFMCFQAKYRRMTPALKA